MCGNLDRCGQMLLHRWFDQSMDQQLDHRQYKYWVGISIYMIPAIGTEQAILRVKVLYGQVLRKLPLKLQELNTVKLCH